MMTKRNTGGRRTKRLRRIKTTGLFGSFDHEITLNSAERVTLMCGPNGVGKTRLLECVKALCSGNLLRLMQVPFDTFEVELEDGGGVVVTRTDLPNAVASQRTYSASIFHSTERWIQLAPLDGKPGTKPWIPTLQELLLDDDRKRVRHRHLVPGMWVDDEGNVWDGRDKPFVPEEDDNTHNSPEWLREFVAQTNVTLLDTQRLGQRHEPGTKGTPLLEVERLAKDAADRIRLVRMQYSATSARLDGTYVKRFLDYREANRASRLDAKLEDVEARRLRLEKLGLMATDSSNATRIPSKLDANQRPALALYVEDMDQKLAALEPYAEQLELFLGLVNRKLRGKSLVTDASDGLLVRVDQSNLAHSLLSAGEQHLIVMLYHLVFEIAPDSLVLIDEPELSQHALWQQELLADVLRIVDYRTFDVVLATHSSHIVGTRKDLCATLSDESRRLAFG